MTRTIATIFCFVFLTVFSATAQVTASFTASDTEGCASTGLQVQFTSTSTGATTYSWDLGNGNTSSFQNPVATYSGAGVYTVVLTASDGTNSDTYSLDITLYEDPVAAFSLVGGDSIGCPGETFDFVDESIVTDGNISSWTWNDGTSTFATTPNASQTFSATGNYSISLFVQDEFGCTDQIIIANQVVVVPPPVIDFGASPTLACTPPLDVTFTNNSTSGLSYTWDFDVSSASTSSTADTVVSYNAVGSYDIGLTVTDPVSCSVDTLVADMVVIENVFATFQMTQDTGCPDVASLFTSTGTLGASIYSWDYGDGNTSSASSGSNIYSTPGDYNVSLSVTSSSGICSDDTTVTIHIEDFTADIAASGLYGCTSPFSVTFTDVSISNASAWAWEFGDGGTSSDQNPVHDYSGEGLYNVTLTATSNNGCVDDTVFQNTIEVSLPNADFTILYDTNRVCFPTVVTLTDNSTPDNTGTLSQWQWDFGNGDPVVTNGTNADVTVTYNSAGEFDALLTVTSSPNGCIDTLRLEVQIGTKLNPVDSAVEDTSCAINPVEFIGSTDADSLVDNWEWFGTGGLNGTGQTYSHQYQDTSAIGWNTDTLVVEYNGCFDTTFIDSIFIIGPIVENISPTMYCDSPFVRIFSATYIDTTTYTWDFGDGESITSFGNLGSIPPGTHGGRTTGAFNNPRHVYQNPGDYTVTLMGWNKDAFYFDMDSCAYTTTFEVHIRDSLTSFTTQQIGCPESPIGFNVINSFPSDLGTISYNWNFGDGSAPQSSVNLFIDHEYPSGGYYHITMTYSDVNGCPFEVVDTLRIVEPAAIFSMDTNEVCTGGIINFTDLSTSDTTMVGWDWNFGDGGTDNNQNASYTFDTKGGYYVTLSATDAVGCVAIDSQYVEVIEPIAQFIGVDLELCAGQTTQFVDQSQGYPGESTVVAWQWNFGDANTSTLQNPNHSYSAGGTYDVMLTVTDSRGCVDEDTLVAYVDVQDIPEAAFTADKTVLCYFNPEVQFTDTTQSADVVAWYWNLNEGATYTTDGTQSTITNSYNQPDTVDISLIVVTSYGCRDTTTKLDYIISFGPQADFTFTPDTICNGDSVKFTVLSTSNVSQYSWDFGDGSPLVSDSVVWYTYNTAQSQYLLPGLKVESDPTCFKTLRQDSVYVHHISASFVATPIAGCSPVVTTFSNSSIGYDLAYAWTFGDGGTATNLNPQHTYTDAGSYDVTLLITEMMEDDGTPIGCVDTSTAIVIVYPQPNPTITPDTMVCIGEEAPLKVVDTSATSISWTPASYLNTISGANVITTPGASTTYTATVTNIYGCQESVSVALTVFDIGEFTTVPDPQTIMIGDTAYITLLDTAGNVMSTDYTYGWSPTIGLDCFQCPEVEFTGFETTTFNITVSDVGGICPEQTDTVTIVVLDEFGFDLPDAFTPNDDGINDVVYVRGFGIKELHTFEIFNRWGEKVYENPGTKSEGWDGTFMGKDQNMDTYVAVAVAENYHGQLFTIKKHITLFR